MDFIYILLKAVVFIVQQIHEMMREIFLNSPSPSSATSSSFAVGEDVVLKSDDVTSPWDRSETSPRFARTSRETLRGEEHTGQGKGQLGLCRQTALQGHEVASFSPRDNVLLGALPHSGATF